MNHKVVSKFVVAFAGLLVALLTSLTAQAAQRASLQTVACPAKGVQRIDLYNSSGRTNGLKIDAYTTVAKFQGWGKNEITSRGLHFVRVQIPSLPQTRKQAVYLYQPAVVTESACRSARGETPEAKPATAAKSTAVANDDDEGEDADDESAPDVPVTATALNGVGGLSNPNCCSFPIATRPHSFMAGMGRFGAGRPGRIHAGVDLYGKLHQSVMAVSNGEVIRAPYFFKRRTLAVDIRHQGGFVARYGEITGQNFGLRNGSKLTRGQQVGVMSYVKGAPAPMLHFELYKGTVSGKLSPKRSNNRYHRRADLVNPTPYVRKWGHY